MNFHQLVKHVLDDTLGMSLWAFRPELVLCGTIVVLLLGRMIVPRCKSGAFCIMLIGSATALLLAIPWHLLGGEVPRGPVPIFTGLLVFDTFSIYMRVLLLLFLLLFTTFTLVARVHDNEDATEFCVLLCGATLGMCLMVSANHMLIVLLGIEMASVPSYVLAGMLRHRRQSTEAALKYAVFGAGTAGVMLYGISLLAGVLGSLQLPTMTLRLAELLQSGPGSGEVMVLVLGGLMLMVGLAFKLSAVPFHFWAPDVFEGATAEVAAFLSIASKAAALGLLVRLAVGFGYVERSLEQSHQQPAGARVQAAQDPDLNLSANSPPERALVSVLEPVRKYIVGLIALIAAVTCTFGNLAAYGQTNIKRLLAYSTIAHAGYMMMAVAAAVALIGSDPPAARDAVAALAFYIGIYLFMNLGAFAAVAFLRNVLQSEQIDAYSGLVHRSPGVVICFSIVLFSLLGLPPLAGFAAKFTVFAALYDARLITLLVIAGLNTVLSLFYYLRVVKVMTLWPEPEDGPQGRVPLASIPGMYYVAITLPLLVLGVWWGGLFEWARQAASSLLS